MSACRAAVGPDWPGAFVESFRGVEIRTCGRPVTTVVRPVHRAHCYETAPGVLDARASCPDHAVFTFCGTIDGIATGAPAPEGYEIRDASGVLVMRVPASEVPR